MAAQIGDRIIVASQKVGHAAREGEILEIIEASYGTRYRRSHLNAVARLTHCIAAAWATGQPSTSTRAIRSCRSKTVSFVLGCPTRASCRCGA